MQYNWDPIKKMQCKWDDCCFNIHNRHYVRINQSLYTSSKLLCHICCSVRADSSSQNSKGNNSGKNHGFLYQNAGNDRWQEPLHTERNTRCIIHDAQHIMSSLSWKHNRRMYSYVVHMLWFEGSSEDLPPDQQIGSLLKSTSGNRQLELHLCKTVTLIIGFTFIWKVSGITWYKPDAFRYVFCIIGEAIKYCFTK